MKFLFKKPCIASDHAGFKLKEDIKNLRTAYRMLFAEEGTLAERTEDVAKMFVNNTAVMDIIGFMRAESSRALTQPR